MTTLILTFIIMLLVAGGLALGVMIRGKPIKGTCGGIASLGMGQACEICGGDTNKCEKGEGREDKDKSSSNLAYNAAEK
jgi:hypothetical protein